MSENYESVEDASPIVDIRQLEQQLQLSPEGDEKDKQWQKCELWANWCIFIVPGRIREKQSQSEEDAEDQDEERFVPQTKTGRQIGVMHYIYGDKGRVFINAMLCIDVVLGRIRSFSPQLVGIDRYDDLGVLQWHQELRRYVEHFFALDRKQRQKAIEQFNDASSFSPEIFRAVARLKNYINVPEAKVKNIALLPPRKHVSNWPVGLEGRDLELFKLLSGMETTSPRKQALSVLNYILPDEKSLKGGRKKSSKNAAVTEKEPAPIRLEPGDKKRISSLLKRFPSLKNRYPYLLFMIENEIPSPAFNFDEGKGEYIYSHVLPASFHFPAVLAVPPKETSAGKRFLSWILKWVPITIASLLFLSLLGSLTVFFMTK